MSTFLRRQPEVHEDVDLRRVESFELPYDDQYSSPLFSVLPGEIRDLIYRYALSDYEDMTRAYDHETCYRRPEYMAPRKTDTALLRTCQAIYTNCWFMPWTQAQHTFFLAAGSRKPTRTTEPHQMARMSQLIENLHPEASPRSKEVENVQIFAQLYILEPGHQLNRLLQIPHFTPRTITITLRHTDIWYWENDHPIYTDTPWVRLARFPASVSTLRIQFESIERRKPQVDYVSSQAREDWFFQRTDDVHLVANAGCPSEELRWTGSSSWEGRRWIRDEDDREPSVLHYYLVTVTFKPASLVEDAAGYQARKNKTIAPKIVVPADVAAKTQIPGGGANTSLQLTLLEKAGVTSDTPASDALTIYQEWVMTQEARRREINAERRHAAQMLAAQRRQQQQAGGQQP